LLEVGTYTFLLRPGALFLKLLIIMWAAVTECSAYSRLRVFIKWYVKTGTRAAR
jgi:hypothetical protein